MKVDESSKGEVNQGVSGLIVPEDGSYVPPKRRDVFRTTRSYNPHDSTVHAYSKFTGFILTAVLNF
jgi:hypothetical protein